MINDVYIMIMNGVYVVRMLDLIENKIIVRGADRLNTGLEEVRPNSTPFRAMYQKFLEIYRLPTTKLAIRALVVETLLGCRWNER
jgi:hypothetical protein